MKNFIFILSIILGLHSCAPKQITKEISHTNIIILSDLSDRIEPIINGQIKNEQYPSKDINEIQNIIEYFKNHCVKPGEKIGDKSSILFSTFDNRFERKIDLDFIKELNKKQAYVNSTGEFENKGFEHDLENFKKDIHYAYDSIRNHGLDLISNLIDKIENKSFIKLDTTYKFGSNETIEKYDNRIYILTDGYLEYKGKATNNQFYFGPLEIEKIRNYCQNNNVDIKQALEDNKDLTLPPVKNGLHKFITLHVYETHERDKNFKLNTYKHPLGLRDNEILKEVWNKWAMESGFKGFEWKKF